MNEPSGVHSRRLDQGQVNAFLDGDFPGADAFLDRMLDTVRCSRLVMEVDVASVSGRSSHRGWAHHEGGALLLDLGGGRYDLFGELPGLFPNAVARLVRLGPRRHRERVPTPVPDDVARAVWAEDGEARAGALENLGGTTERWCWSATTSWPAAGDTIGGHRLAGMAGPEGWWRLVTAAEGTVLEPTTPTELWTSLVDLLPADDEVAPLS